MHTLSSTRTGPRKRIKTQNDLNGMLHPIPIPGALASPNTQAMQRGADLKGGTLESIAVQEGTQNVSGVSSGLLNTYAYIYTHIHTQIIVYIHGVQYVVWKEIPNLSNLVGSLSVGG